MQRPCPKSAGLHTGVVCFIRHTGMHTNKFALRCLQACEACSSCFTLESLRRPREQALAVETQALFTRAVQR